MGWVGRGFEMGWVGGGFQMEWGKCRDRPIPSPLFHRKTTDVSASAAAAAKNDDDDDDDDEEDGVWFCQWRRLRASAGCIG